MEDKESTCLNLLIVCTLDQSFIGEHSDHHHTVCSHCQMMNIIFYQISLLIDLAVKHQVTSSSSMYDYSLSIMARKCKFFVFEVYQYIPVTFQWCWGSLHLDSLYKKVLQVIFGDFSIINHFQWCWLPPSTLAQCSSDGGRRAQATFFKEYLVCIFHKLLSFVIIYCAKVMFYIIIIF